MKTKIIIYIFFFSIYASYSQCFGELNVGEHVCTIKPDGTLWGWGFADYGQLALPDSSVEPLPFQISPSTNWIKVRNGAYNTFAIKSNGTLWATGGNSYGSLGISSTVQAINSFQQIGTATNWVDIAVSDTNTLGLKSDGTVWAWGQNDNGEMGNGTFYPQQNSPIQVGTDNNWASIETLKNDTYFAIKTDGTLWALIILQ